MMGPEDLMIVRTNGPSLLLITQPDHAALAGRVMREWRAEDSWTRPGAPTSCAPSTTMTMAGMKKTGRPSSMNSPVAFSIRERAGPFRQAAWPRGIARLVDAPYSAALVARARDTVDPRYRQRPGWSAFFADMKARRDEHLAQAHDAASTKCCAITRRCAWAT